jgi:UPF0755 protein
LLSIAAGAGLMIWQRIYDDPGPLAAARDVVVPHGGIDAVGQALLEAGVIADTTTFRLAVLGTYGEPLHAAELAFPPAASLRTVLTILRTGHPVEHQVTIPEGITAAQIALLLDRADGLTGEDTLPPEGAVMPSTYKFERGATRAAIVARASAAMTRNVDELWTNRAPGLPLQTAAQAVVLASIVERETAKPEERSRIAAVFLNRLRLGMRLQSDPTVVYASSGGLGVLNRPLTRADLDEDSPYNTYRVSGLPPTPIDSPGLASVRAVLHPAQTDELYFVADGSGGHAFAKTLEEHAKNVGRFRKSLE